MLITTGAKRLPSTLAKAVSPSILYSVLNNLNSHKLKISFELGLII